jgi:DNA-binding NarL/FixJ family response regulator
MAKICIVQEKPGDQLEIRRSLEGFHELVIVESASQLMELRPAAVDLIISRVYLEYGNVFAFLHDLKQSEQYRNVPFVCLSGLHTLASKRFDPVLADASIKLGADGYIVLDNYCTDDQCDCAALRSAIERFLRPAGLKRYTH